MGFYIDEKRTVLHPSGFLSKVPSTSDVAVSNMPPVALIQRRWCIGLVIIQGWVQSLVYWLNEFSQSQEHVYNPGWPITSPGVLTKASPHHWLRSRLRNLFNFSALRGTRIPFFYLKLCHFLLLKKWFSWQDMALWSLDLLFWGYEALSMGI